jgi:hypothetical protein
MLESVTTTLEDIQKKLLNILHPRTILIGHSLNSDLTALKLTHPFIIDTAVIYPHPRGPPLKSSLKWLAQKYLNREIQKGHGTTGPGAGHDSIEDARTCLDLVKQKCEKGKEWGTSDSSGENIFKRVARAGVKYKNQGGSAIPGPINGRTSAMVDWGDPKKGAGAAATHVVGCKNDAEVVEGVIRAVNGDHDGKDIPGGGVDFVFGRLRELEALKGWWNSNKVVGSDQRPVEAGAKQVAAEPPEADVMIKTTQLNLLLLQRKHHRLKVPRKRRSRRQKNSQHPIALPSQLRRLMKPQVLNHSTYLAPKYQQHQILSKLLPLQNPQPPFPPKV